MWLKRPANLTEKQRDLLDELLAQPLQTVRAYTLSQQFDSFYELDDPATAEEFLRRWIAEVDRSDQGGDLGRLAWDFRIRMGERSSPGLRDPRPPNDPDHA